MEFTPGSSWEESGHDDYDPSVDDVELSTIYFRSASKKRRYSMDNYKFITLLGDLGGILDLFMAFGTLITIGLVKRAFDSSLLGEAYQVQGYLEDKSEFYESQKAKKDFKNLHNKSMTTKQSGDENPIQITSEEDSNEEEKEE